MLEDCVLLLHLQTPGQVIATAAGFILLHLNTTPYVAVADQQTDVTQLQRFFDSSPYTTWYVVSPRNGPVESPLIMPPHIHKQQPLLLLLLLLCSRRTLCCCRVPSRRKQVVAAVVACVAWTASSSLLLLLLLLAGVEC
jgi:hypothetical protein